LKVCNICKIQKALSEFSPRKNRPCGFDGRCKLCQAARSLNDYYSKHSERKEAQKLRARKRYVEDSSLAKFHATMRKEHVKRATPSWANKKALREFYKACPAGYHVDHIIPLRGKNISGLHVVENLQYLLAKDNMTKHNTF
jgi:hypothetical protein